MTLINKRLVLAARPSGLIKNSDFRMEEAKVPDIQDGEFLVKTKYLSLAPVMKFYMLDGAGIEKPLQLGETMRGRGVGEVIDSRHPDFQKGDFVGGKFGWQEYVVSKGTAYDMMYKFDVEGLSPSTALGVLGVTGFTSYFGLYHVGALKENENILVSSAAGGVGSSLGFLSKIKSGKVVGLTSTNEKKKLLTEKLGYDFAINYKIENISEQLDKYFPEGIDVYFDNVGGEILDLALSKLRRYARVVCCGRISTYKDSLKTQEYQLKNWHKVGSNRAKMEGFFIYDFEAQFAEAKKEMIGWIKEGRLKYQEDILQGLEKMPEALNRLFEGKNIGKQLVKVN